MTLVDPATVLCAEAVAAKKAMMVVVEKRILNDLREECFVWLVIEYALKGSDDLLCV